MLLDAGREQDRRLRMRMADARNCEHRRDRVALVRHRRGAAGRSLRDLGDLGLREQNNVAGDLAERAGGTCQRSGKVGERRANGVPGHGRLAQVELRRVEPKQLEAVVAERCERTARAAELSRQVRGDRRDAASVLDDADQPPGCLHTEGGRHRLLQQRPRGEHGAAMLLGETRTEVGDAGELVVEDVAGALGDQHRRRVEDVLARRAAMHVLGVLADALAHRPHQRLDGIADGAALLRELIGVVEVDDAGGGDHRGRFRRDEPGERPGVDERALGVEEGVQPGAVGHRSRRVGRHEDRLEGSHAKNTVCDSPCMRISNRNAPPSAAATSVAASAGPRAASTGSVALAASSSGK